MLYANNIGLPLGTNNHARSLPDVQPGPACANPRDSDDRSSRKDGFCGDRDAIAPRGLQPVRVEVDGSTGYASVNECSSEEAGVGRGRNAAVAGRMVAEARSKAPAWTIADDRGASTAS